MKLAVISHTAHYKTPDGTIVGWGPTVSEINYLAQSFDEIYHIAFFHKEVAPPSALPYTSNNIHYVALRPSGGKTFLSKFSVLTAMPSTIAIVQKVLKKVDVFQLRTPIGMGVYLIPWLTLFSKKQGWYKYAGNWKQEDASIGYRLQRKFLKKQSRKVTINGFWDDQPAHCLSFENPCLTNEERLEGASIIKSKSYQDSFSFCFVGRLEDEKGVQRIIDAFATLPTRDRVGQLHFIGNGPKLEHYKAACTEHGLSANFHGFLSRTEVFDIYRSCQFLLLPSTASEGFPKVIAEAMNFGCIPMVSTISSITQYINSENGYILEPTTAKGLQACILEAFKENPSVLLSKAKEGHATAKNFTFERYTHRILNEVLLT